LLNNTSLEECVKKHRGMLHDFGC